MFAPRFNAINKLYKVKESSDLQLTTCIVEKQKGWLRLGKNNTDYKFGC